MMSSVTVLVPATTVRLTTVEAVLAELPANDQVLFVERLIDDASAAIARELDTILAQQRYLQRVRGTYATPELFLRYWPLVAVDPVSLGTEIITDYRIESIMEAMLYRRATWGIPRWSEEEWTVEYVAGFILPEQLTPVDPTGLVLPADLERACIETCKVWFHERLVGTRVTSKSFGLTGDRIDYGVQAQRRALPMLTQDLLYEWKRVRIA